MEAEISDVHQALQDGTTTCQAVVEQYIQRIGTYDQPTGLNTIITRNFDGALTKAGEIDDTIESGGDLGSLYCVPVLVKDLYDTFDLPTSGGNLALADSVPPDDSFLVRQLREADAIMLAKTNMDEFAFNAAYTLSSLGGLTRNAYDLTRTPAGSSGGSASGLTANFGLIATASDTGNSIRGPASHAALVGLRSTIGVISRDGVIPLILERDMTGVLTRTVADTAKSMNVIAGYDPADPITELSQGNIPDDYTDYLDSDALGGARIGVFREKIDDSADPQVIQLFNDAVADLRAQGAIIVDPFDIPNYETLEDEATSCFSFRFYFNEYLESLGDDRPVEDLQALLDSGKYESTLADSLMAAQEAPDPIDADPPCVGEPGNIRDNPSRLALRNGIVNALDQADIDAIIYPTWNNVPQPLGDSRAELPDNVGDNSQSPAPLSGTPAITVPMGFTGGELPTGLQFLGRPFDEPLLISLAYSYEQATNHRKPPAMFPALE